MTVFEFDTAWRAGRPEGERDAFCQAGHAVLAWLEGLTVICVSIQPEDDAQSWIDVCEPCLPSKPEKWREDDRALARALIRALFAGYAAEAKFSPGGILAELDLGSEQTSCHAALWHGISIAGQMPGCGPPLIPLLWEEVRTMLNRPEIWKAVEAVARSLLLNGELSGSEVASIAGEAVRWFTASSS